MKEIELGTEPAADVEIQIRPASVPEPETTVAHPSDQFRFDVSKFKVSAEQIQQMKNKRTKHFYEHQNEMLESVEALDSAQSGAAGDVDDHDAEDDNHAGAVLVTRISLLTNIVLLGLKIFVVITSGSLTMVASALDSVLDLFSGTILWSATRMVSRSSSYEYPAGARRAEPVGIVIFSTLMTSVALQLAFESVQLLASHADSPRIGITQIVIMLAVILAKAALYVFCRAFKNSPTADSLAQDHRNDVITNTLGITCYYLSARFYWWIDPTAALLFALFLMYSWITNGKEFVQYLVGRTADPAFLQQITYVCLNHNPLILKIDTVRAFHFGWNFIVEVDIVLPETMTVKDSHDIGEALQHRIEKISRVERAIVHIDYEWNHKPFAQTGKSGVSWRYRM